MMLQYNMENILAYISIKIFSLNFQVVCTELIKNVYLPTFYLRTGVVLEADKNTHWF
jgi:hypothetical protein